MDLVPLSLSEKPEVTHHNQDDDKSKGETDSTDLEEDEKSDEGKSIYF